MEELKILKELPPAPAGIREWILKDIVKETYLIYSRKKGKGYCTRCGKEFDIGGCKPKHNSKAECPCCGRQATYKAEKAGRKGLTEYTRVLYFVRKGQAVYGILGEVNISFEDKAPKVSCWFSALYQFTEKRQLYFKHYPGWCFGGECWKQHKNVKVPIVSSRNPYYPPKRQGLHIYLKNFSLFEKSCLKYANVPELIDEWELTGEELIRYMDLHLKYQSMEILRKAGFEALVLNKVGGKTSRHINWRAKDIRKILKLDMGEIRKFRGQALQIHQLETYQEYKKKGVRLELDEIALVSDYYMEEVGKAADGIKVVRYLARQNREHGQYSRMGDYLDYIRDCQKLGLDIRKNSALFPPDFYAEHMRLVNQQQEEADKRIEKGIKAQIEKYKSLSGYHDGGLLIQAMSCMQDLRVESSKLGHCVKMYGERVARGECMIFFIRKLESPEEPYYTLELREAGGKYTVVQCRGKGNCSMTEEVNAFVDKWMEAVEKKKGKKAA